jgi:hypothetical protein
MAYTKTISQYPMIEWRLRQRGTYATEVNGIELDVWRIGRGWVLGQYGDCGTTDQSSGWRWTALKDHKFVGSETGLASLDAACEAAIKFAEMFKQ